MNEPAIFQVPSKTMPDDVQHRIEEPGFTTRTASHLGDSQRLRHAEHARDASKGLLKLEPNLRPFVMTRASYAGGQRYAVDVDGRQFEQLEPSAADRSATAQPGSERVCDGGSGCGRICRFAAAGAADTLAGGGGVSANRPRPHGDWNQAAGAMGERHAGRCESAPAVHRRALSAVALSLHHGGGDEPDGIAD